MERVADDIKFRLHGRMTLLYPCAIRMSLYAPPRFNVTLLHTSNNPFQRNTLFALIGFGSGVNSNPLWVPSQLIVQVSTFSDTKTLDEVCPCWPVDYIIREGELGK